MRCDYTARPQDGVAWVSGASSGIGRALVLALAAEGWRVAATARSADKLAALEREAEPLSGSIHAFPGDVTDGEAMASLLQGIETALGPACLLIANAGVYVPQDGLDSDLQTWRVTVDVNLMGTVHVLLPAIARMKSRRRGQIGIVASVAGYGGLPTSAAYGATKAALINMAEALTFDLARAGLRLQVINPGFVDTPATAANPFPMPYLMQPEQAAEAIIAGLKHKSRFEIAFPKAFVRQLKLLRLLPYGLYFKLIGKSTGWDKKGPV